MPSVHVEILNRANTDYGHCDVVGCHERARFLVREETTHKFSHACLLHFPQVAIELGGED